MYNKTKISESFNISKTVDKKVLKVPALTQSLLTYSQFRYSQFQTNSNATDSISESTCSKSEKKSIIEYR